VSVCNSNKDSRKIFLFFCINFGFMFIELTYGYLSNSLGLITDSFHMLFDCFGLFIGLTASYISQLPSNKYYTFGYAKVETLSGFFNGLLLVFTAFNVLSESVHRILEPQSIDTSGALLPVSCIGFMVNMIGVIFFSDVEGHHHEE
jgi:solute carrier family 30 (zinc transporter), member 5/7